MKTIIITIGVLFITLIIDNCTLLAQWVSQNSYVSTSCVKSLYFIDETTGCLVGNDGIIFKSTDGGYYWSSQTSGTTKDLNSVFFINANQGWAVGDEGTILYSNNGGISWTTQVSGVTDNLNSVYFINNQKGWITGENGVILYTTNGGDNTGNYENIENNFYIDIYPNPATDIITIKAKNIQAVEVSSVKGQVTKIIINRSNKIKVDLSEQPKGPYFVKVTTDKGTATKKVVLE